MAAGLTDHVWTFRELLPNLSRFIIKVVADEYPRVQWRTVRDAPPSMGRLCDSAALEGCKHGTSAHLGVEPRLVSWLSLSKIPSPSRSRPIRWPEPGGT